MKKIKSVKIISYSRADENFENGELLLETIYDQNNNVLSQISYNAGNELESKIEFKYNSDGQKTEEIIFMTEDEINEHILYTYNENKEIVKEEKSYADGSKSFKVYQRNPETNIVTIIQTSDEGELEEKEIRVFDGNKQITEVHIFNEENQLTEKHTYEYLEKDLLSRRTDFDNKNEIKIDRQFFYDENKNLIKQLGINRKRELIEAIYISYDDKNRKTETRIGSMYLIKYEYDDEARTVVETRYSQNGMIQYQNTTIHSPEGLITEERELDMVKKYTYEFFD